MLADNPYGGLLGIGSLLYYSFLYMNPWVVDPDDQSTLQQSFEVFVKYIAVLGAIMIAMTRGKSQGDN